jgi:hypothetical protein
MGSHAELRSSLGAAMSGRNTALSMADSLCRACVPLLDVDGAAIALLLDASGQGAFGSSDSVSRQLEEAQFACGQGPSSDAVRCGSPIFVEDLAHQDEQRWPSYVSSALHLGARGLFVLPIWVAGTCVGTLNLYRRAPRPLLGHSLLGAFMAAELAALPLMEMINAEAKFALDETGEVAWDHLTSLARVEVYQATGMLMVQFDVGPADALARLRAHAFKHGVTATAVALSIVQRTLSLKPDRAARHAEPLVAS